MLEYRYATFPAHLVILVSNPVQPSPPDSCTDADADAAPAVRGRSLARVAIWLMVSVWVASVAIEAWSRYLAYQHQLAQSRVAAQNVAQAAEEHAEGTMNTVAWLLNGIVDRVEADGLDPVARSRLVQYFTEHLQLRKSPLQGVYVSTREGRPIIGSGPQPAADGVNADREYFQYHRTHDNREMHIGGPIVSRSSGQAVLTLSRRWNQRDGRFGGTIHATIPVEYFQQYYKRFSVGQRGSMLLAMADGTVVTRRPSSVDVVGSSIRGTPLFDFIERGGNHGTVMLMTRFDGRERLMSYRYLDDYPFLVVTALSKEEIFEGWWTVTWQEGAAVIVMLSVMTGLGWWLIAHIRLKQQLERRLGAAYRELEQKNASLDRLARTDALTGLSNRRYLDECLAGEVARLVRSGGSLGLILVDVDFFKRYNDTLGHAAGDDCLRKVAGALSGAIQRPADVVARFGGEEFALLLPATTSAGALHVGERVRAAVAALGLPHPHSEPGHVTISVGVACITPDPAPTVRVLVESADAALYRAKGAGRNRVSS